MSDKEILDKVAEVINGDSNLFEAYEKIVALVQHVRAIKKDYQIENLEG